MSSGGSLVPAEQARLAELEAVRGEAEIDERLLGRAVRLARGYPTRPCLQLAFDTLEREEGYASSQLLIRIAPPKVLR